VSRAGAGSISELCLVGKPVIFIPSPNVAEDHQTKNAESITIKQAAILLKESEISTFSECLETLIKDEPKQMLLAKNIKKLALPNATKQIADEVEKILR
jgi:UDP-N-acetylglucosamine--N-acetylmuramyl-(pentapeptide) pyrophosphoryl-undecaprenol N-acetylglucosamine transferase